MTNLKKAAAVFVLSAAASVAHATPKDTYYPETPTTPTPVTTPTNNNNANQNANNNANNNAASADANARAVAAANAAAQAAVTARQNLTAEQRQMLDVQLAQQQANSQTLNGGATNVQTGATSMTNNTNYQAPKTFGNVAPIIIQPSGNCGSGWGVNLSTTSFGVGAGGSKQSITCLSAEAARVMISEGRAMGDKGMIAVGVASYRRLFPAVEQASHNVILTLRESCWKRAAETSIVLLTGSEETNDALKCDGEYVAGTKDQVVAAETALKEKAEGDARAVDLALQLALEAVRARDYAAKLSVEVNVNTAAPAKPAAPKVHKPVVPAAPKPVVPAIPCKCTEGPK